MSVGICLSIRDADLFLPSKAVSNFVCIVAFVNILKQAHYWCDANTPSSHDEWSIPTIVERKVAIRTVNTNGCLFVFRGACVRILDNLFCMVTQCSNVEASSMGNQWDLLWALINNESCWQLQLTRCILGLVQMLLSMGAIPLKILREN